MMHAEPILPGLTSALSHRTRARRVHARKAPVAASFAKELWAIRWDTDANSIEGPTSRFVCDVKFHPSRIALFDTRQKARDYVEKHYGYLKERPDLRAAPHGWQYPVVVRVRVTAFEVVVR